MLTLQYGYLGNRITAYLIDVFIVFLSFFSIEYLLDSQTFPDEIGEKIGSLEVVCIYFTFDWLYLSLMESSAKQATLGKMITGLVVTDTNGNRLTFWRATRRYFAKWLSFFTPLLIGLIMAAFTKKKQALHDKLVGTLVYQKRRATEAGMIATFFLIAIWLWAISSAMESLYFQKEGLKAKQSEAKVYINAGNEAQQNYYEENNKLADNFYDLQIGIKTETSNYSYKLKRDDTRGWVISTATTKTKGLSSYSGIVYIEEGTTKSMICETNEPSFIAPDAFESVSECPPGSSEYHSSKSASPES